MPLSGTDQKSRRQGEQRHAEPNEAHGSSRCCGAGSDRSGRWRRPDSNEYTDEKDHQDHLVNVDRCAKWRMRAVLAHSPPLTRQPRRYVLGMEPRTVWQEQDSVQSGGGAVVRAAAFSVRDADRGGVTLTVQVPQGFWSQLDGGGASATLLLNPDEARGIAAWLDVAADAADEEGPPLYG